MFCCVGRYSRPHRAPRCLQNKNTLSRAFVLGIQPTFDIPHNTAGLCAEHLQKEKRLSALFFLEMLVTLDASFLTRFSPTNAQVFRHSTQESSREPYSPTRSAHIGECPVSRKVKLPFYSDLLSCRFVMYVSNPRQPSSTSRQVASKSRVYQGSATSRGRSV